MKLRSFRLYVTYYIIYILCKNAISESTIAKVYVSINNAFQSNKEMFKVDSTQIDQSVTMETKLDGIILKNNSLTSAHSNSGESSFMQNLSTKMKMDNYKTDKCSRYCIQKLKTDKGFEDVNLTLSFAKEDEEDYFLLKNNPNLKILESIDDKNLTILDYCQIYLNLHCNIINIEKGLIIQNNKFYLNTIFNRQDKKLNKNNFSNNILQYSEILIHKTNLSGYTETNFETSANVTGIVINIFGNLTHAVLIIPTNGMADRIVMSLTNTYNTKGVAIGARNLPGRWCMKLTEVENSKYSFDVIAYYATNKKNNVRNDITNINFTNVTNKKEDLHISQNTSIVINKSKICENVANNSNTINLRLINPTISKKLLKRSAGDMNSRKSNARMINFSDILSFIHKPITTIDKNINFVLPNNSLISYGEFKILSNMSTIKEQKIQARSSEVASLNEDIDMEIKSSNIPMQMANSDQNQKFSTQVNEELVFEKKKILLDLNVNSKLTAAPGTTHRVIFDATNNCILPVRYVIQARSSPFRIYNIQPIYMWLYPGQSDQVAVDILIPAGSQDTINTLTLQIAGTEISEKTVQIFVQNALSKNVDNVKPTIEYSFNSNCAGKLDKDRCEKTLWSADITVRDTDSGLKSVISIPNKISSLVNYVSGTKDSVKLYYSSTCCTTTATITAIDVAENQYTRTLDVTAWDNLSQGEIAAIVLGALFLLLLLILLVVAIVYCVGRRSSRDLPYTQRYGSRQPARSERTSF